ncbi:MAG TPA: hypothetical protein VKQ29_17535 [Aliidongia sp.]|nr:hypothetical protein [Aliidongia sp.]
MQADADAAEQARRQAQGPLDPAEAIYRQAAELLPSLARSALMAPIRGLGVLLRGPVAGRNEVAR